MEGADDAVVRFTVNTASLLTSKGLVAAIRAGHRKYKEVRSSGNISLKKLTKQDQGLQASEEVYHSEDLKFIKRELKKNGVDFAVVPSAEHRGKHELIFKAKDHETVRYSLEKSLNRIVNRDFKQAIKDDQRLQQGKDLNINKSKVKKMKPPKKARGVTNLS